MRTPGPQWAALVVLSSIFAVIFEWLRLPAALLLGPMAAGILVAARGGALHIPPAGFGVAQAIIACLIARGIPASVVGELWRAWPLCLATVAAIIAASSLIGWLLTRWRVLPGTTAIWGTAPGAATAMMMMAEAFGADIRLVAFMQFLRVVMVAVAASLVARIWVGVSGAAAPAIEWFPALDWMAFAETLVVAASGALAARYLRLPAGPLLLPMVLAVTAQETGLLTITLPPWLLAAVYTLLGWSVGLSFSRPILLHAARALPKVAASILALMAICGGFAAILVAVAGVDPLTAYLATSPGGVDSVAIIAASSHIDMPFIMAMQTMRLVVVILTGPALARFLAGRSGVSERRGVAEGWD